MQIQIAIEIIPLLLQVAAQSVVMYCALTLRLLLGIYSGSADREPESTAEAVKMFSPAILFPFMFALFLFQTQFNLGTAIILLVAYLIGTATGCLCYVVSPASAFIKK